jgi:hypothetical protein
MVYLAITIALFLLLFVPFIPVGGNYYRGLLIIYYKDYLDTGGGFIRLMPDIPYLRIVRWANPIWFRYVFDDYARDHRFVYSEGYRLEGSDPETFRRIATPISIVKPFSDKRYLDYYYVDHSTVRHGHCLQVKVAPGGQGPKNFDAESFDPLGGGFVRDKTGVYYFTAGTYDNFQEQLVEQLPYTKYKRLIFLHRPVEIVDPETFHITKLSNVKCEAEDKNFVYEIRHYTYGGATKKSPDGVLEIVGAINGDGFRDLGCRYYQTNTGLFFSERRLAGADKNSFEVIAVTYNRYCYPYARDKNHVYFMSKVLKDADPSTFQVVATAPFCAFDHSNRYVQGNKISELPSSRAAHENKVFEEAYEKWQSTKA